MRRTVLAVALSALLCSSWLLSGPAAPARANGVGTVFAASVTRLVEYEIATGTVVVEIPEVATRVSALAFSTDARWLFIADDSEDSGAVRVLSVEDLTITRKSNVPGGPRALAVSSDGALLWVGTTAGQVYGFSTKDLTPRGSLDLRGPVQRLQTLPGSGRLLALSGTDLVVINTGKPDDITIEQRISLPGQPLGVAVMQTVTGTLRTGLQVKNTYWVALRDASVMAILNDRFELAGQIDAGGTVQDIAGSPAGDRVVVILSQSRLVKLYDQDRRLLGDVQLRGRPSHVVVDPDSRYAYVTTPDRPAVAVLSMAAPGLLRNIPSPGAPTHLAVIPYRMPLDATKACTALPASIVRLPEAGTP